MGDAGVTKSEAAVFADGAIPPTFIEKFKGGNDKTGSPRFSHRFPAQPWLIRPRCGPFTYVLGISL